MQHRNFRWFWISTIAQAAARGMQFLIIGWLVLVLTDSASQLGLVALIYGMPNITLVLFGGIFADRIDRRNLLIGTQTGVTIIIFILATLTITDLVSLWHIYVATFGLGVLQALNMPSRMAIVVDLVDREDLMNAVVLNSAVMNTGRILGPAVAGGIIELIGIGQALYLNAGCYLVATAFLLIIKGLSQEKAPGRRNILGDLMEGFRYYWSTPVTFAVITIGFSFGFLGMPYVQIMPAFAKEVFSVGAAGSGLLITGAGVGSLVANVAYASLGNYKYKNWLLIGCFSLFGIGLILFAWSTSFWLSWIILALVGMGSMVPMGTTVLQLTTPPRLQGRVLSLWYVSAGFMFIGSFPMALVAESFGWPVAIGGGAAIFLLVASILGVWRPALRNLRV